MTFYYYGVILNMAPRSLRKARKGSRKEEPEGESRKGKTEGKSEGQPKGYLGPLLSYFLTLQQSFRLLFRREQSAARSQDVILNPAAPEDPGRKEPGFVFNLT